MSDDVISLVLDAEGIVVRVAVGAAGDIPVESGETAIVRDGAAAEAWIGWARGQDGTYALPVMPVATLSADELRAYTAVRRYDLEVGGTTWNGWPIYTDDRAQGKYLSELAAITLGVRQDGEFWKFADGVPRPLTNVQVQQMAIAARSHVTGTFGLEFQVLAGIAVGTVTTPAQVNVILASAP